MSPVTGYIILQILDENGQPMTINPPRVKVHLVTFDSVKALQTVEADDTLIYKKLIIYPE